MSSGQFNETENPPKSYLGEIDRQPGPCFGTRPQGIIEERGEHRRGQLLAESDREAHGASDSADLLGVGAGLDQRSDLLQICRPRELRTRRKEPLPIEHQTKRRGALRCRVEGTADETECDGVGWSFISTSCVISAEAASELATAAKPNSIRRVSDCRTWKRKREGEKSIEIDRIEEQTEAFALTNLAREIGERGNLGFQALVFWLSEQQCYQSRSHFLSFSASQFSPPFFPFFLIILYI